MGIGRVAVGDCLGLRGMRKLFAGFRNFCFLGLFIATGPGVAGCGDVVSDARANSFQARSRQVQNEVGVLRPGELGPFLDKQQEEKLRYVAYRKLESQRERLRSGGDRWMPIDIVALAERTRRDMKAEYQPLRALAEAHYVWARLEGFEAGQMQNLLEGPYVDQVLSWVNEWGQSGRPIMEGRMNRHDLAALQGYAIENLPDTRRLLRWTFEQDQRPGQVAGLLGREWTEGDLVKIMRLWCTSEGWTPLAHTVKGLTSRERDAVYVTLARLDASSDPLVRRESKRWRAWFDDRVERMAAIQN